MANGTCSLEGCTRTGRLKRGWCDTHYARWRRLGDVGAAAIEVKFKYGDQVCEVDSCETKAFCKDLCNKHYQRLIHTGTTDARERTGPKPCSIESCDKASFCKSYCRAHYARLHKHGDPLGSTPRQHQPEQCTIEACSAKPLALGLCMKHHARWRFHGDPSVVNIRVKKTARGLCGMPRCEHTLYDEGRCESHYRRHHGYLRLCANAIFDAEYLLAGQTPTLADRFFGSIDKTKACWLWTATISEHGYGLFVVRPRLYRPAHRVSWVLAGNSLKRGYHLDHLCRVRNCVNPDHLEQVTPAVNNRRGEGPAGRNFRKTHCIRGHEFDLVNTYYPPSGERHCRTCGKARYRAYRHGISIDDALLLTAT